MNFKAFVNNRLSILKYIFKEMCHLRKKTEKINIQTILMKKKSKI